MPKSGTDGRIYDQNNQNSLKSLKLLSQQIRKHLFNTLGTSVINSLMYPLALSLNSTI